MDYRCSVCDETLGEDVSEYSLEFFFEKPIDQCSAADDAFGEFAVPLAFANLQDRLRVFDGAVVQWSLSPKSKRRATADEQSREKITA